MPRMPTEQQLPSVGLQSRQIVSPPRDFIGPALVRAGETIGAEAEATMRAGLTRRRRLTAEAKVEKTQNDALDLARATAEWNRRVLNERAQYSFDQDQDYPTWGKRFDANSTKHMDAAANLIRDPKEREMFRLRVADDRERYSLDVQGKARAIDQGKRRTEGLEAINKNLESAARPDVTKEEAGKIIMDARVAIDNLAVSGLLEPEEAAKERIAFSRKYASIKTLRDIETDPEQVARWLKGVGSETYFLKLRGKESGGDDLARPGTSTAEGRYQFTTETWAMVARAHPELGLTENGRKDAYQQERAIRAFTHDNMAKLQEAGLDVSEKTLYLAHFLGPDGAIAALQAHPDREAAGLFPKAAAANKAVFYNQDGSPKTIAEVIANQTRNFSGEVGPAPGYYEFLDPDQRLQYASAAEAETARRYKEAKEKNDLERFQMTNLLEDDIAQVAESGVARPIETQTVVDTLGETAAAKWLENRKVAADTYAATAAMESMSDNAIEAHLESLEPQPGAEDFANRQKVYKAAERRADKLVKLRLQDPAESVADSALVKTAMQGHDPTNPAANQSLVRARYAAQQAVGIPPAMQQPITRAEARKLIAPIQSTIDLMDATIVSALGTGKTPDATRRIAAKQVRAQAENQIRTTVEEIERLYGDHAQKVLAFAIAESVRDKEIGDLAASVLRKIAKGEKVKTAEAQALDAAAETSAAQKALAGGLPAPAASAPPAGQVSSKPQAREQKVPTRGTPPKAEGPGGKLGAEWPPPSQRAVDYLRRNPATRAQFEAIYGPGSAATWVPL